MEKFVQPAMEQEKFLKNLYNMNSPHFKHSKSENQIRLEELEMSKEHLNSEYYFMRLKQLEAPHTHIY